MQNEAAPASEPAQLDLFERKSRGPSPLERELSRRRQEREEAALGAVLSPHNATLLPLALALARLAAHRDARSTIVCSQGNAHA